MLALGAINDSRCPGSTMLSVLLGAIGSVVLVYELMIEVA